MTTLLTPNPAPLSPADAAHLLRRTSFGATEAQIQALVGQTPQVAAEGLLSFPTTTLDSPFQPQDAAAPAAAVKLMQAKWLREMVLTPYPLRERLTLLWSNHFVIGTDKVKNVSALEGYLSTLRTHTLSNFADLALAAVQTPAVLRYLDNDKNKKGKPNENLGREMMELFTIGIGHYTEQDVKEAARALTGWTIEGSRNNKDFTAPQRFVFNPKQHDAGSKTYLGQTGTFSGEDAVRLAAGHPATAQRVAFKLWRAFVSDAPSPAGEAKLAATYTAFGGDLKRTLSALLGSQEFYASRGSIIRSPVEFVVGALRTEGRRDLDEKTYLNLTVTLSRLGQELLHPPTVKGWDGGREWINDGTLLLRMQVAAALSFGTQKKPVAAGSRAAAPSSLALLGSEQLPAALSKLGNAQRLYLMLVSPEYQLI